MKNEEKPSSKTMRQEIGGVDRARVPVSDLL
jgi:hypothetical protein